MRLPWRFLQLTNGVWQPLSLTAGVGDPRLIGVVEQLRVRTPATTTAATWARLRCRPARTPPDEILGVYRLDEFDPDNAGQPTLGVQLLDPWHSWRHRPVRSSTTTGQVPRPPASPDCGSGSGEALRPLLSRRERGGGWLA